MINVGGTFADLFRQLADEFNHSESLALLGLAMIGLGLGLVLSSRRRTSQPPQTGVPEQTVEKRSLSL